MELEVWKGLWDGSVMPDFNSEFIQRLKETHPGFSSVEPDDTACYPKTKPACELRVTQLSSVT